MEARSVGIVGVGLIGGSIALAALRAGYRVYLYDRLASEKLAGAEVSASAWLWMILRSSLRIAG